MSHQSALHPISLQYQARTSKQGNREVEQLLQLLGELQNPAIRHRRMLGKARVPTREILRLQNSSITDLRQNDPDFANIARRLAESVVKRVNHSYHRAYTVPNAGFPRTQSPYHFRTLEISEPVNKHVKFRWYGRQFVRVPAQHTSQTCPACGNVDAGNSTTQAQFHCLKCGTNADVIGAENIRCRGVETMARVGNLATRPASVDHRTRKGSKQRTKALQRPMLLFTKTQI